jgi:glycosyltransferase involved in cell wall biosynthesis
VIDALVEQGHDVRLAVGRDDGAVAHPCPIEVVPALDSRGEAEAAGALDRLADGFAPDVIHVHTVVNPAALEWAAARGALITVQDHRYFCPTRGKWTAAGRVCSDPMSLEACAACFDDDAYFRDIYALTSARLTAIRRMRIIVLSRYMKAELVAAGVPVGQIEVVPPFVHGLDLEAEPDGPPCVLFVGRLSPAKGPLEAAEAWRLSGLDLPMVVAGAGPMRQGLEKRGAEVLGWIDHRRLSALYRRAAVMAMPSRWQEPFGIAGLEALTLGVPVVAWNSGGVAEWHPGDGLVPWGDIAGLALALRQRVGRRAAPPPGFDRETQMERLGEVYRKVSDGLVSRRGPAAGSQPTPARRA